MTRVWGSWGSKMRLATWRCASATGSGEKCEWSERTSLCNACYIGYVSQSIYLPVIGDAGIQPGPDPAAFSNGLPSISMLTESSLCVFVQLHVSQQIALPIVETRRVPFLFRIYLKDLHYLSWDCAWNTVCVVQQHHLVSVEKRSGE